MTTVTELFTPLAHRGPRSVERVVSVSARSVVHRVTLPAGVRLVDALDRALAVAGVTSGQVELLDGTLSAVAYCYPALGGDTGPVVGYCSTQSAVGPVRVVAGSATVGFRDGRRFVHCHAAWFDAEGATRGGHLWPDTWIGAEGLQVSLHALVGLDLVSTDDPESLLPVFAPTATRAVRGARDGETRRAVMCRVLPGENVVETVTGVMRAAGFVRATIGGTLGSLVGASFHRPGGLLVVDGPVTEVSLVGVTTLDVDGGVTPHLSAVAIDRHGRVHTGRLTDHNIVGVTMELLVEELST